MRLLIIGLDGATWSVIDPLMAQGRLPNLARLMARGTRFVSTAVEPVLSPIIWTSLASGKLPQKHGVTHFSQTANSVRCRRLWDILEEPDRPVGLFAWPVTWPPAPVNGFVVPSLFARSSDTFPPELRFIKELEEGLGKGWRERVRLIRTAMRHGLRPATVARIVQYAAGQRLGRYNALDRFAEPRFLKLYIHLDVYEFLVRRYRPYFTSFYLNQVDAFSHRFWRYYQPRLFQADGASSVSEIRRYADMIPRAYELADQAVGRLVKLADRDTLILVVSDHGFEAASDGASGAKFQGRVLGSRLLGMLNLSHQANYVNYRDWVIIKLVRAADEQRVEILDRLRQFRVVELGAPLLDVREDETGEIAVKIHDRTHLYRDDVDLDALHVEYLGKTTSFLELVQSDYDTRFSGVHHPDGIAIFCGPGVRAGGEAGRASVLDVVPTVLALLGEPIGRDMDGKALAEVMLPEYLAQHPISYIDSHDTGLELVETDEEEAPEELMSRLRALGYVD